VNREEPFLKRWARLKRAKTENKTEKEKDAPAPQEAPGTAATMVPGTAPGMAGTMAPGTAPGMAGTMAPGTAPGMAGTMAPGTAPGTASQTEADRGDPNAIAELPPIESLGKDSDYRPFMREGVPQALRLAALRKLWASDPALAAPDPLDLHNLDYTHLAAPGQVVSTSYRIGKGFAQEVDKSLKRVEEARSESEGAESERAESGGSAPEPPGDPARDEATPKPATEAGPEPSPAKPRNGVKPPA